MPHADQDASTAANRTFSKTILIEGWRATNHSFAVINRYQIRELQRLSGLRLFHHDAPFHVRDWKHSNDHSEFSLADRFSLNALTDPGDEPVDCVYRIFSPFRASAANDRRKTVSFLVTEMGPLDGFFEIGSERPQFFTREANRIVTPTRWSRDRLADYGFATDKISIVPHGVDRAHFHPLTEAERQAGRAAFGISDDEIVFLNVGAWLWNKGTDLLLFAFAHLHRAGRRIRLILRDRVEMYGRSLVEDLQNMVTQNPGLFSIETMAAIAVIQSDISQHQLRHLYGLVDCYVSPYRAEGFNLPVLEAIACGTPVIVTRGGATDDFCSDRVAIRIPGKMGTHKHPADDRPRRFIHLNINDLAGAMDCLATRQHTGLDRSGAARDEVVERFSWRNAAVQLAKLTIGYECD